MSLHICAIAFDWYPFHPRVRCLAEAAAKAGHSVDVISLRQPEEKSHEVYENVNIYRVPQNRGFGLSLPLTILAWCWFLILAGTKVTWLHLKKPYDIVVVHNMPDFLIFSALFPKLLKAKVILDVQDACPEMMVEKASKRLAPVVTLLASWQERISTAFADHVVTVGWTVEELLLKRGVRNEKLTSIFNSANPTFFPPARRAVREEKAPDSPFILMFHGTIAKRQGLDIAMRALPLVRSSVPQVQLHIKGVGEEIPFLKDLARELNVDDLVTFSGPCPIGEVVDFVQSGDVGIIPYQASGYMELVLPVKAFEFAWMHRPMISSDVRGMRLLFRPESVLFCEADKPAQFAEAIIDLYQHPEKQSLMVANAAEDYSSYRWEVMEKRYQMLLASLCYEHRSASVSA